MKRSTNPHSGDVLSNTTAGGCKNDHSFLRQKLSRWIPQAIKTFSLSISLSLLAATQADAGSFSFTKIADNSNDFTSISIVDGAAINDNGTVAFIADPQLLESAVYTSSDAQIKEIIRSNLSPSLLNYSPSTKYIFSNVQINNNGTLAFLKELTLAKQRMKAFLLAEDLAEEKQKNSSQEEGKASKKGKQK